ncbi:MAG: DUF3108 domain-containing protein [Bacteroidota bacterium]
MKKNITTFTVKEKFKTRSLKLVARSKMPLDFRLQISVKISIFVFINIWHSLIINAQCKPAVWSFQAGEELYYDVVYNWGFIWVEAGSVDFKVHNEQLDGREVFHFESTGTSLKKYDWFFKVRDYYDSWAEIADLKPIKYSRNTSEGKQKADNKYWFDYKLQKIYTNTWNSKRKRKLDTLALAPCIFDIMTAVYYVRTLDLSKYKINEKIPLSMIVDNEIYVLYGRYLGKETIKTREEKKYDCLKFSISLVEGTMFKGGEDLTVWVSNDNNRIPLLIEAKILVGSVKATFNRAKNIKHPLHFEVDK